MDTAADPEGWLLGMTTGARPSDPMQDIALTRRPARPARAAADLAKASMSENTRRAYETALRGFERSGNPETDAGIAAYLGDLCEGGHSAAVAAMARLRHGL